MALNKKASLDDGQLTNPADYAADDSELEIDLVELMYHLLENAKYIILAAVLGALIAGVYTFEFVSPLYQATSKLYILNDSDSVINVSDLQLGSQLANDYVEVFKNWHVHELVDQRLGLNYSYKDLSNMISVSNPANTRIIYIKATSPSAQEACDLANAYSEVAREFISVRMGTVMPNVFEEARVPNAPSSPNKTRNIMIGVLLGMILACGILVIHFLVDDRIRSAETIEKRLDMPVLGMMPIQAGEASENHVRHKQHKKGGAKK